MGFGDWLGELGSGISDVWGAAKPAVSGAANIITPLAQLGTAGLGVYAGIEGMQRGREMAGLQRKAMQQQSAASAEARAASAPARAAGEEFLGAGKQAMLGGALPAGLEARVQQWKTEALQRIRSYLAANNITDSTSREQWEAWADQQAAVLRSQYAEQLTGLGYKGIETGVGPLQASISGFGSAGQTAGQGAASINQLIQNANQALQVLGGSSKRPQPAPGAPVETEEDKKRRSEKLGAV